MSNSYIISELKKVMIQALKLTEYQVAENDIVIEINQQNNNFGDYACPIALHLVKKYRKKPQEIAQDIVNKIAKNNLIIEMTILGPGFINFTLNISAFYPILNAVIKEQADYGKLTNNKIEYNIEFVSANPTGLLHLGHARNAAIGSSLANILQHQGYQVTKEYYINDAGNQINILARSLFVRYQNLCGAQLLMPEDSYHGQEVIDGAKKLQAEYGNKFYQKEFDEKRQQFFRQFGIKYMLEQIQLDLKNYDVLIDIWFSEASLYQNDAIIKTLDKLAQKGNTYQAENATWLKSTNFKDDKDRVLIKSDGSYTYLLPDLAYHDIKFQRSDLLVNIWGADHAGYIARMKAGLIALGYDANKLVIVATQMVRLIKDGQEQKMSKRTGTALTLRELLTTIGKDALRYFMVARSAESHLDIDIKIATSKTQDNPMFYLQYGHARINQIINQKPNFKISSDINLLNNEKEKELLIIIDEYKLVLNRITEKLQPHLLTNYLQKLAKSFHSYYNECKIINHDNDELTNQRLTLVLAVKWILFGGLKLIGVTAPNKM